MTAETGTPDTPGPARKDLVRLVMPMRLSDVSPLLTAIGNTLEDLGYSDIRIASGAEYTVSGVPPTSR